MSKIAGIDLVPAIDFDVGHINISIDDVTAEVVSAHQHTTNGKHGRGDEEDDISAFAWHRDSYPFVCVTMLSDCTGMVGGETALRTGTGEIMKVRGPAMVSFLLSLLLYSHKSSFEKMLFFLKLTHPRGRPS